MLFLAFINLTLAHPQYAPPDSPPPPGFPGVGPAPPGSITNRTCIAWHKPGVKPTPGSWGLTDFMCHKTPQGALDGNIAVDIKLDCHCYFFNS